MAATVTHTQLVTSLATRSFSASKIAVAVEDPAVSSVTGAGPHLVFLSPVF